MKISEVLTGAASIIGKRRVIGITTAIDKSCPRNINGSAYEAFWKLYRPDYYFLSDEQRILALCLAAAIAESEGL